MVTTVTEVNTVMTFRSLRNIRGGQEEGRGFDSRWCHWTIT